MSLTAAGRKFDVSEKRTLDEAKKKPYPWQTQVWDHYDSRGEVWFAGRYVSNSLSRLRIFPAMQVSPDEAPIAITNLPADVKDGPTDEEISTMVAVVGRLANSQGGISDIIGALGLNNFLVGECVLVGLTGSDGYEEWSIQSYDALTLDDTGKAIGLLPYPGASKNELISLDGAFTSRIWRRHPRWPEMPDTAMRPALEYCEDLRVLTMMIRAAAWSRLPSGMLALPLDPIGDDDLDSTTDDGDGAAEVKDKLLEDLLKHFTTPKADPSDVAALVPFLLRLDPSDLEKIKQFDFSRDIDKLAVELRAEARASFATTVDLPADVLTGKGDMNRWTAWNVDDEAFRVHLANHAEVGVDGLTAGFFWPNIESGVQNPRHYRIWYDATDLVVRPNRAVDAKDAHKALVISDAYLRDALSFPEEAAPDEAEITRRLEYQKAGAPSVAQTADTHAPPSATASAAPSEPSTDLGLRLARIEHALLDRLVVLADAEMRRALERAGNRARTAAARADGTVKEVVASCTTAAEVCPRLGPSLVAALGLTPDDMLNDAFLTVEQRFVEWTRRAQRQALAQIDQAGDLSRDDRDTLDSTMADHTNAAVPVLIAALGAAAGALLFAPTSAAPTVGEWDSTRLVAPRVVRSALAYAGGGPPLASPLTRMPATSGLLSGQTITIAFGMARIRERGFVWVYGDESSRSRPYEPHLELDGEFFTSWEDSLLSNTEDWPDVEFLYPDDHDGCQCTYAVTGDAETADRPASGGETVIPSSDG